MHSWNVLKNDDDTFTLLNDSATLIRLHRQVSTDVVVNLMSKLEEIEFPVFYSNGLKEIYFTFLKSKLEGDYDNDGKIRITCNKKYLSTLHEILIHEIGHHVDAEHDISNQPDIMREWLEKSGSFKHVNIKNDPSEYFAFGFEMYHADRSLDKNVYPVLWSSIDRLVDKK